MVRARKIMGTGASCVVKIDMTNEVAESEGMVWAEPCVFCWRMFSCDFQKCAQRLFGRMVHYNGNTHSLLLET